MFIKKSRMPQHDQWRIIKKVEHTIVDFKTSFGALINEFEFEKRHFQKETFC